MANIIILNYFHDEVFEKNISLIRNYFLVKEVREGYKGYKIGEKIKVVFREDNFNIENKELEFYIIDILIQSSEKNDFGLLVVPNERTVFSKNFNPILQSLGYNLQVPIDSCFFVKFNELNIFEIMSKERMTINVGGYEVGVSTPKLYKIPKQTISKLFIYDKIKKQRNKNFTLPAKLYELIREK